MRLISVVIFLMLLILFDFNFSYNQISEFSLVVGLPENYSLKEFLSWFLVYSYMYTGIVLSGFNINLQLMHSHTVIRYEHRWKVMNVYIKKNLVSLFINIALIMAVVSVRKMLTPSLLITSEYIVQLSIIITIGLASLLLIFVTKNLYVSIIGVNAYILGTTVFSTAHSDLTIVGFVLKYGSFLNRFAREGISFVALECLSIFIVVAVIVACYITAKKISYL